MPSQFTQQIAQAKPSFDFVAAHFQCEANRYSRERPDGFVNFGSAQNFLHEDLLRDRLASVEGDADDTHYQSFSGTIDCRLAVADYLASQSSLSISPDSIVVGNGIISVLEALTLALLDEGDSVLVPTPVFPGLVNAMHLRVRSKVELMHTGSDDGFRLTPAAVEAHLHRLNFEGKRVRAILICSPGNPVGQVFSEDELREFLEIAEMFDCALIVDEVYAGSLFEGHQFASAISLQSDNVYVLGGLSKDFGLAGHATGWLHSINEAVNEAVAKQSHFFRLPSPVQRIITSVLHPSWRHDYLRIHHQKLSQTEHIARRELQSLGIPVTDSQAGLCLWLDLRASVRSSDAEGELQLYQHLLNEHRVHISPGSGFRTNSFGFFRICFSQPTDLLAEGLDRLRAGLRSWGTCRELQQSRKAFDTSRKVNGVEALQQADAA